MIKHKAAQKAQLLTKAVRKPAITQNRRRHYGVFAHDLGKAMNEAPEKWTGSPLLSLWRRLGPGLVTGAADDDPSGIATHSQIGAQFGFQLS